jgi:hypothetical protein
VYRKVFRGLEEEFLRVPEKGGEGEKENVRCDFVMRLLIIKYCGKCADKGKYSVSDCFSLVAGS